MPRSFAVFVLKRAALSQVSFVTGLGNSCNQPLLANRPSKSVGSRRKTISHFPAGILGGVSAPRRFCFAWATRSAQPSDFGKQYANFELAIIPSCSDRCQNVSKSPDALSF